MSRLMRRNTSKNKLFPCSSVFELCAYVAFLHEFGLVTWIRKVFILIKERIVSSNQLLQYKRILRIFHINQVQFK